MDFFFLIRSICFLNKHNNNRLLLYKMSVARPSCTTITSLSQSYKNPSKTFINPGKARTCFKNTTDKMVFSESLKIFFQRLYLVVALNYVSVD